MVMPLGYIMKKYLDVHHCTARSGGLPTPRKSDSTASTIRTCRFSRFIHLLVRTACSEIPDTRKQASRTRVSASIRPMRSPVAASNPALRANATPGRDSTIRRTRGSPAAMASTICSLVRDILITFELNSGCWIRQLTNPGDVETR